MDTPVSSETEAVIKRAADAYLPLYGNGTAERIKLYDRTHNENDIRFVCVYEYSDGGKLVIKTAKNGFTTPERVVKWAELIEHYNTLGVYAPRMLKNTSGGYVTEIDGYVCYSEEFMDGDECEHTPTHDYRDYPYGEAALETLGMLAANPARTAAWRTAWCLYDKFDDNDPCDERYEYAQGLSKYFAEHMPKYADRAAAILRRYERLRSEFESVYRSLPQATFQGDLSNIVLTQDKQFKGLIDFNLSGSDTILNYIFCECSSSLYTWGKRSAEHMLDRSEQDKHDERMARFMRHAFRHYKLSDAERNAFTRYYQIGYPFLCNNKNFWAYNLSEYGELYTDTILTWIERQMNRIDADVLLP